MDEHALSHRKDSPVVVAHHLDCLGLFCPIPIVRTREAMKEMQAGEILEMLSDDPASDADIKSWTRRTGNHLLEVTKSGIVYRFLIKKT